MRRRVRGLIKAAIALTVAAAPLGAQQGIMVFAGAGAQLPTGGYKNSEIEPHKNGGQAILGFEVPLKGTFPFRLRIDGSIGRNDVEGDPGDRTNIIAGSGVLVHYFNAGLLHPYALGGAGVLNRQYWPLDGPALRSIQFSINAGAGLAIGPPLIQAFGEIRYVYGIYDAGGTHFIPIVGGLRVAFRTH